MKVNAGQLLSFPALVPTFVVLIAPQSARSKNVTAPCRWVKLVAGDLVRRSVHILISDAIQYLPLVTLTMFSAVCFAVPSRMTITFCANAVQHPSSYKFNKIIIRNES